MSENRNLEWKSSWKDKYLKWICGFANAQGGVLAIGKNDRGKTIGVKDPLRLLEEIPNKVQTLLGIVVDVNLRTEDDSEYLEITVEPCPNPISYKGKYHYRSGSTKQVLKGAALNRFLLRKHGCNWDDAPMPGIRVKDLDSRTLDDFRQRGMASGRLPSAVLKESDSKLMETLHLREGAYLRQAAALLFCSNPVRWFAGAFVKIGYFRTETDLVYQDVIEGNLFTQVDRTVDLLRTKYAKAEISYKDIYRVETPLVPGEALREAVLNAVVHRDYSHPAPIQIRVYDDRISLWNPRALSPGWTLEKMMSKHASVPHNPAIANAFFRAGMIETWGRGIGDIVKACRAAATVEPHWQVETYGLWLEFVRTGMETGRARHTNSRQQPELQPESLKAKVLSLLVSGPMSKAELSRNLGQKKISGQLNKVVRQLMSDQRITYTRPDRPRSRLQKYRLTDKRHTVVTRQETGNTEV